MKVIFKCRMCRQIVLNYPEISLISVHGQKLDLKVNSNSAKIEFVENLSQDKSPSPCSSVEQDVIYINEINIPQWITECIDKHEWTRGKLKCPGCAARLGSFDFVSGFHCACQTCVVPAIHLVRSKIDFSSSKSLL